jgi:DNA polymerase III subunit gamma/tau
VYQSLYRRYRSKTFAELLGQPHVNATLLNAIRNDRVGHAYLFSGPRGTGKTSTARILAKALNCYDLRDGEPCGTCASCVAVDAGTSFDVHEHDAASNRGINEIRAILDSVHLATPGRTKVYILDEVHMLTKEAEAALLKTLEEPPPNVVFVLATTDPQKVNATIISRTQPLTFHLLPMDVLDAHVRHVIADAALSVDEPTIAAVLRAGGGSARDTLSALEQAAAAGGLSDDAGAVDEIIDALAERDTGRVLAAVATCVLSGRDPRALTEALVAQLRDHFLALMAPQLVQLPPDALDRIVARAKALGAASTVRAVEVLGTTLVDLRTAPDPRLLLDVALIRLTRPELDPSPAALLDRIERLERQDRTASASTPPIPAGPTTAADTPGAPPPGGRSRLGAAAIATSTFTATGSAPVPAPPAPPASPSTPSPHSESEPPTTTIADPAPLPTSPNTDVAAVWTQAVLPALAPQARALLRIAQVRRDGEGLVLALPNAVHRDRCAAFVPDIEAQLMAHAGRRVGVQLTVGGGADDRDPPPSDAEPPPAAVPADLDDELDAPFEDLADAPVVDIEASGIERLVRAFPGSQVIEQTR